MSERTDLFIWSENGSGLIGTGIRFILAIGHRKENLALAPKNKWGGRLRGSLARGPGDENWA